MVVGVLTYFFPPNVIALGFTAVVFWAVIRPDLLRVKTLAAIGLVAAIAVATVVFYLQDAIRVLSTTLYPGQRISGGGGVSLGMWLTQLLPTSQMNHHVSLVAGSNICEQSTIGSVYVLAVACFGDVRGLWQNAGREERRRLLLLTAGLLATQAWMVVPLPPWAGYPLLWHLVPPGRMVLAGGLMLMIVAFVIAQSRPLVFSAARCTLFVSALVLGWVLLKQPLNISFTEAFRDWIFIVPVLVTALLVRFGLLTSARANGTLLASAAVLALISFGTFNPIQSTVPMFTKPDTPVTRDFDRRLQEEGRGYILEPWGKSFFSHSGLPLIGLGYPSLSYSTFDPAMDLWRQVYPDVPAAELRSAFQNVGSFGFGDVPAPKWQPIYTLAPMAPFVRPGATVCDFIRPSRTRFAGLAGCLTPTARTEAP
jgi:hypothetical protein